MGHMGHGRPASRFANKEMKKERKGKKEGGGEKKKERKEECKKEQRKVDYFRWISFVNSGKNVYYRNSLF